MSTATKRWWRVVAMAVVAGGAIGVARYAAAEPIKPPLASTDDAVWSRSAPAVVPPAAPPPAVVQAAAAFPVPPAVVVPPPPALDPPAAGPRAPLSSPMLPGTDLPGIPPAPKAIDISPVAPPSPLVAPPLVAPPTPLPLPAPAPFVPSPPETAQPAPPAKLADPVQPFSPVVPDFNLQPPKTGNTVRTEDLVPPVGLPVTPVAPPVTSPIPSAGGTRGDVPATTVDRPKPVEAPLLDSEKFAFPLPTTLAPPPTPPPGDPIMTQYFRQAALAAVIGGALAVVPLSPVTAQTKTDPTPAELKKAIDETDKKLVEIDKTLKRLTDLVEGKKDEKGFYLPSDMGVVYDVKTLTNSVKQLQEQIDKMKKSESLRVPNTIPPAVDAMAGKGTVRVVNDYPIEISMLVNEQSYRIAPSTKKDVPVPAGDFTYQLLQNGAAAVKSTIKEKEVVTLRIKS